MPIVERDPWRMQYFEHVACPRDVLVPTEDSDAYRLYPAHRWVYNKLLICEKQGLEHGPHGTEPPAFPVFSKPIYNLRGMGAGSQLIESAQDYAAAHTPGHMWMQLLEGEHVSTDCAVIDGEPQWWRHTTGIALGEGIFDYWTVHAEPKSQLEMYCGAWLRRHLEDYTGMVNFETIGGAIIECHLRFADQWVDLYGPGWVESVVELYARSSWRFDDDERSTGYSVVLFGGHGLHYVIDHETVEEIRALPEISSVQITFHTDRPTEAHAMPPGGFRLAIVNCLDLEAGLEARERLALMFWSTQEVRAHPHVA